MLTYVRGWGGVAARLCNSAGWYTRTLCSEHRNHHSLSKRCFAAVALLCLARFVHCYYLIFSDTEGTGNMFTADGVADLFRTKGDRFVVGLWTELLTLFLLLSLALVHDGEDRRL